MTSGSKSHHARRAHRLLALLVVAWLNNLVMQPCLAQIPVMPAGMEHCHHGSSPADPAPCPEMQAVDCEMAADLNTDAPRPAVPARTGALLALLPVAAPVPGAITAATLDPGGAAGPSRNIRFCNLRN